MMPNLVQMAGGGTSETRRTTTMAAATTNDDALVDRLARALARTDVRADGPTVDRVQRALRDWRDEDFENMRPMRQSKKTATPYEVWRAAQSTARPKKTKVLDARARKELVNRLDAANKQRTENAELSLIHI